MHKSAALVSVVYLDSIDILGLLSKYLLAAQNNKTDNKINQSQQNFSHQCASLRFASLRALIKSSTAPVNTKQIKHSACRYYFWWFLFTSRSLISLSRSIVYFVSLTPAIVDFGIIKSILYAFSCIIIYFFF